MDDGSRSVFFSDALLISSSMFERSPQKELENIMFRDVGRWKLSGEVVEKGGWWRMRYSDKAQGTRFEDLIFHNFHKDKLQMQKFSRSMLGLKSGAVYQVSEFH